MTDAPQAASPADDDALGGDLALDPEDAGQVTGGARYVCPTCHHTHSQADPPCFPGCTHGTGTSTTGFY